MHSSTYLKWDTNQEAEILDLAEVFIEKNVTLGMKMQVKLPGPTDQGQEKRAYIER